MRAKLCELELMKSKTETDDRERTNEKNVLDINGIVTDCSTRQVDTLVSIAPHPRHSPHSTLIHLIDLRARRVTLIRRRRPSTTKVAHIGHTSHTATRHTTTRHTAHTRHTSSTTTTASTIRRRNNRSPHLFDLLLLGIVLLTFRVRVGVDPVDGLFHDILHLLLVLVLDQVLNLASSKVLRIWYATFS